MGLYIIKPPLSITAKRLSRFLTKKHFVNTVIRPKKLDINNLEGHLVINYGGAFVPPGNSVHWINHPEHVNACSNKIKFFNRVKEYPFVLEYTRDPECVKNWLEDGKVVVGRKIVRGHSGIGASIISDLAELSDEYKFYTKFFPSWSELRLYFVGESFPIVRQKRRKNDGFLEDSGIEKDGIARKIRTHKNGWIYSSNISVPSDTILSMKEATSEIKEKIGLDFGAADFLYSRSNNDFKLVEINTAPGLEGTNVTLFGNALIKEFLQ